MKAIKRNFRPLSTSEDRRSVAYVSERAVFRLTEDIVRRMDAGGVTRAELARRMGVQPAYVTKILRGTGNFTLESMVRIARALDSTLRVELRSWRKTRC
jgi:hypothetical protein